MSSNQFDCLKGAACFPISIDGYLIDVYYFQRSYKKQENFQSNHYYEMKKLLKHVSTNSLNKCLARFFDLWDMLLLF